MKKEILFFNTMLTPKIITLVYWLLILTSIIVGLSMMFGGWTGFTFYKFLTGLFAIGAGIISSRIWCELLIVIFKINENLSKLKE
mgnify:CR=1 FL=1